MLGLKRLVDVLVQLLIGPCSLCGIKVATTDDLTMIGVEVERRSYGFEFSRGKILCCMLARVPIKTDLPLRPRRRVGMGGVNVPS